MKSVLSFIGLLVLFSGLVTAQEEELNKTLFKAITDNDVALVTSVLEQGANIEARQFGFRPLHMAVIKGHTEIASVLIEYGADTLKDAAGFAPIHLAVRENHIDILALLLDAGVPIESKTTVVPRHPTLMEAIRHNANEAIYFLIEQGADINNPDQYNDTPLNAAAFYGNRELLEYLIAEGVELEVVGFQGNTGIDWAEQQEFPELAEILRQAIIERASDTE